MKKSMLIVMLGVFVAVMGLGFAGGTALAAARMPDFALKSVMDGSVVESSSFQGKVLLITFFATWCPPCIEEIPTLKALHEELAKEGFSVVGLSVDQGGPGEVVKMVKKNGIPYPVLMADEKVMQDFGGVYGIPVSFLVSSSGNVVKKYPGYVPGKVLEKDIKSILK